MDTAGLWKLFFRTGLPQVWLAIREAERDREQTRAVPAFRPHPSGREKI